MERSVLWAVLTPDSPPQTRVHLTFDFDVRRWRHRFGIARRIKGRDVPYHPPSHLAMGHHHQFEHNEEHERYYNEVPIAISGASIAILTLGSLTTLQHLNTKPSSLMS